MSIYSKVCGGGGSDASRGSSSLGTTHFRDFSDSTLESGYLIVSVSPLFLALFSLEYVSLSASLYLLIVQVRSTLAPCPLAPRKTPL